jgi:Tol biopolymer transport system component
MKPFYSLPLISLIRFAIRFTRYFVNRIARKPALTLLPLFLLLASSLIAKEVWGRGDWGRRRLTTKEQGFCLNFHWSRDSKSILLLRETKSKGYSVWIVDFASGKMRKIMEDGNYILFSPRWTSLWSHDSRYIAMVEKEKPILKIWIVDVRNNQRKLLTENGYDVNSISWSPSELKLVSTVDKVGYGRTSDYVVYLYDLSLGVSKEIYKGGLALRFSPDGRYLLIHSCNMDEKNETRWGLVSVDVETLRTSVLVEKNASGAADWSPDGKKIAYHIYPDFDIWLLHLDGGIRGKEKLASNSDWPLFSPDGEYLAFLGYGLSKPRLDLEVAQDLCVLELKNGKVRQITFNGVCCDVGFNPRRSDLIAYITLTTSVEKGKLYLYKLKEEKRFSISNKEIPLNINGSLTGIWDWSPDGRYIAYIQDGELWIAGPFN